MKKFMFLFLLLSGCATISNFPNSISYIYIKVPDKEEWKHIRNGNEEFIEGVIKDCLWVKSDDIKSSRHMFIITSNNQDYLSQLLDDSLYLAVDDAIYKCELDINSVKIVESLYDL